MNKDSSTIFYDQRIVISAPIETPIVWTCTKVEQLNPKGIARYTFSQERWSDETDKFEYETVNNEGVIISEYSHIYNPNKKLIGMWANYSDYTAEPTPSEPQHGFMNSNKTMLSYSGVKPEIKSGGSYKKFTVQFYKDGEEVDYIDGNWKFTIDDNDCSQLIDILTSADSTDVNQNQIKVKFKKDDEYIGKVLKVNFIPNDITYKGIPIDIDIVGL